MPKRMAGSMDVSRSLRRTVVAAAGIALACAAQGALALTLMVGGPPGSPADTIARRIASSVQKLTGQEMRVENRAGGRGTAAADAAAKASPDGNTIVLVTEDYVIAATEGRQPYDAKNDLMPVTLVGTSPVVLVVDPAAGITSIRQLVQRVAAAPGKMAFAVDTKGGLSEITAELFKIDADVEMPTLVFDTPEAATQAIKSGKAVAMFDNISGVYPRLKTEELRPIAVANDKRSALLPRVATLRQTGIVNFEVQSWYGVLVAKGTNTLVIQKLATDISNAMRDNDVIDAQGTPLLEPVCSSPLEFSLFLKEEFTRWQRVAQYSGLKQ